MMVYKVGKKQGKVPRKQFVGRLSASCHLKVNGWPAGR